MTRIPEALRKQVIERAKGRCEYCLMPQQYAYYAYEVDHIYATKHSGESSEANLAYSCFWCNRHKGSDIASLDPTTKTVVRLYHPRLDDWDEHFELIGAELVGKTDIGRVTAKLLQFNAFHQQFERAALIQAGAYP